MNKLNGLRFLKKYNLPTVDLLKYEDIMSEKYIIKCGLSIRLSSKISNEIDVNLKSIHNCMKKNIIKQFYNDNYNDYDILIHRTVKPDVIGSISKYFLNDRQIIVVETFKDFFSRSKEIVEDREIYEYIGKIIMLKKSKYYKILNLIKDIPFESYDIEFVIEKGYVIFTDFYSKELNYLFE